MFFLVTWVRTPCAPFASSKLVGLELRSLPLSRLGVNDAAAFFTLHVLFPYFCTLANACLLPSLSLPKEAINA